MDSCRLFNAIQTIAKNDKEILGALKTIEDGNGNNFDADDIALASSSSNAIMKRRFCLYFNLYANYFA